MENDHLEDALLFLRSAVRDHADTGRVARHDLDRAIEEIEKAQERPQPSKKAG